MTYLGSVRFFKNLIFLLVVSAIAIPTGLAATWKTQLTALEAETTIPMGVVERLPTELGLWQPGQVLPEADVPQSAAISPEVPAYQALYPDFYAPQALTADHTADKTIYLTFDDGPSERTDEILEILAKQDVKATFFVVGHTDEASLGRMRSIVDAGHTLGMHSYSHNYKSIYASVDAYLDDMYRLFTLLQSTTGVTPTAFRFPGGSINGYNYGIYQEILSEMLRRGFIPYDWNLSSGDAAGGKVTTAKILAATVGKAKNVNRGFILMHDSNPKTTTVTALDDMIVGLRDLGFSFAPITTDVRPILFNYSE